jgi:patatin-related protein
MAWNGGVSLAVWMGGVAVELDCARRAHLSPENAGSEETPAPRETYHVLCQTFDRMLVPDIIAGASAGGVNGALIAGAVHAGRRLHPDFLREEWLNVGDFSRLLQPTTLSKPPSLMQGDLFYNELKTSFERLLDDQPPARLRLPEEQRSLAPDPSLVPDTRSEVLLDVQVTNVLGQQRWFLDEWNQRLLAREYRAPLRFRRRVDFTAETLASAARASASFPAAFAPHELRDGAAILAGFANRHRWAIDGGLLENAPIRPALELIPTQRARRGVKRFVCYVNAAPPVDKPVPDLPLEPPLRRVLEYVVNLPRDGRFVDQLVAIEEAARRAAATAEVQPRLLELEREALCETAAALLDAYRRRRGLESVEEIVTEPGRQDDAATARRVFAAIRDDPKLPWLPQTARPPASEHAWDWGIRPAERVLHLQIDVLRGVVDHELDPAERKRLRAARAKLDDALLRLESLRADFELDAEIRSATRSLADGRDLAAKFARLERLMALYRPCVYGTLRQASAALYHALKEAPTPLAAERGKQLFGNRFGHPEMRASEFEALLERALSIELVRRSLSSEVDLETAQQLHFTQLTPNAPIRILSSQPFGDAVRPSRPDEKLTGLGLGHFAGFYRRSWRANDFMWGRLDAAARIVDLLVDPDRTRGLQPDERRRRAGALARLLAPAGAGDEANDKRWLVHEVLASAGASEGISSAAKRELADYPRERPDEQRLGAALVAALAADLGEPGEALFTRVLCARAAQYEVLRQELPVLVCESSNDASLGCSTKPLRLKLDDSLVPALKELRRCWQKGGTPLPRRIGFGDRDEETSTLALRTITQALLVALAALNTVSLPLAKLFTPARVPVLAVSGLSARRLIQRLSVLLGFVAAAFYIAARLITTDPNETAPFGAIWDPAVLLSWVSALGVLGLVFVPGWRAYRTRSVARRVVQALDSAAFLATGGLVAVSLGIWKLGVAATATTPGAFAPPHWVVVYALLAAVVGPAALRRLPVPGWIPSAIQTRVERRMSIAVVVGIGSALVFGWSVPVVAGRLQGDPLWKELIAWFAFAGAALSALYLVAIVIGRLRRRVGANEAAGALLPV